MLKIIYYVDKAIEYFLAVIRKLRFTLFFNLHYSQNGEDAVLYRAFPRKYKGFYVDVGAHHPMRFSNTYYFYKLGWSGINIDPSSTFSNDFSKIRSRDINLNFGVSNTEEVLDYFMFKEAAYNSFKVGIKEKPQISKNTEFIGVKKVALRRLDNILDEYLPKNTKIDFSEH